MGKFSEGMLNDEIILKNLNICPGQTILDAGFGNGYMAEKFLKFIGKTGKVYAIDSDKWFVADFKRKLKKETNINAFVGDITKVTDLKESSIDLVYLSAVFHIFSDIQILSFTKEVARVLKPKAQLAIINFKKEETPFGPPVTMRTSPEELRERISLTPEELIEVGEHFYMQIFVNY